MNGDHFLGGFTQKCDEHLAVIAILFICAAGQIHFLAACVFIVADEHRLVGCLLLVIVRVGLKVKGLAVVLYLIRRQRDHDFIIKGVVVHMGHHITGNAHQQYHYGHHNAGDYAFLFATELLLCFLFHCWGQLLFILCHHITPVVE